jgi:hypothetical protein
LLLKDVNTTSIIIQDSIYLCQWTYVETDPDFHNIINLERRGYALSKNYGRDWEIIFQDEWNLDYENLGESINERSLYFKFRGLTINSSHRIFYIFTHGFLIFSDDYGASWNSSYLGKINEDGSPNDRKINDFSIYFKKNTEIGLFYYHTFKEFHPELIFVTTDNGNNWKNLEFEYKKLDTKMDEDDIRIRDIYLVDKDSYIIKLRSQSGGYFNSIREFHISNDKGLNWNILNTPDSMSEFHEIIFPINKNTYLLTGHYIYHPDYIDDRHYIYKTTDGGNTWRKVFHTNDFPSAFSDFVLTNNDEIIALSMYFIMRSYDLGETWQFEKIEKDTIDQLSTIHYDYKNDRGIIRGGNRRYWELTTASSVKRAELLHFFSLYPNPAEATSRITLDFHNDLPREIEIYDLLGNLVLSSKPLQSTLEIDISKLSPATYIVKSIYGDQSVSRKFVKK